MKGIILTGGKSKRMGQDKAQLKVNGVRLVDRVYDAFRVQVDEVIISGSHDYGLGLAVVTDIASGPKGPVAALYAVWMTLKNRSGVEGFFTVPVDTPNLPHDLCEKLYGDRSSVAMAPNGMHQAFAWWRLTDLERVFTKANFENSISLKYVANQIGARQIWWEDEKLFYNINTPNDLRRYLTDAL